MNKPIYVYKQTTDFEDGEKEVYFIVEERMPFDFKSPKKTGEAISSRVCDVVFGLASGATNGEIILDKKKDGTYERAYITYSDLSEFEKMIVKINAKKNSFMNVEPTYQQHTININS